VVSPRSAARHRWVYRAVLRLYPPAFREHYGDPMAQLFGDQLRRSGIRAWLPIVPDLIRTVPMQRIEAAMSSTSPTKRVVAIALIVLGAAVASLGVGGGLVPVAALAVVGVLATQQRLFVTIPRGERAPFRHAAVQAWWAPVATVLGLVMILAGIGTIFEAHNWGGRIVGSGLFVAFGSAMLFGLMRRPFARQAGNTVILLATIPALLFFWVVLPPLAAIVVWVGVLRDGFDEPALTPLSP
jgi:hypothetical protein